MNLRKKIILAVAVTGVIPALIISLLAIYTTESMSDSIGKGFEDRADAVASKIDRNLFERYGDVQAFGTNEAVNDHTSWYQVGAARNKIANAANNYATLYGFYLLSFMVDTEGRVVAVNDKDPSGKLIDTAWLYQKNFKDTTWFKETLAGRFLKGSATDGTYVQDPHFDEDVKKVYNTDGLVLGFSAPVKDANDKVIGIWHNCANFSLVEEIVQDTYNNFKKDKQPAAEIALLDSKGLILVDCDPSTHGGNVAFRDPNTVLKTNLVEKGLVIAKEVIAGKSGHGVFMNVRKQIPQMAGYVPCSGELGFKGLGWGVIVRLPKTDALAGVDAQVHYFIGVLVASIAALISVGWIVSRNIASSIQSEIDVLQELSGGLQKAAETIANSSQAVAAGASEQAASLEETSASLEEISAMARRTAENAQSGKNLSQQARVSADSGLSGIEEMSKSLGSIRLAVRDMETAVSEMQGSSQEVAKIIKTIDEIAFQTNLLALNAAVEAARAGEAGMGFAVVADEVRALAQRSAQAAKETSEKIESSIKRSEMGGVASDKVVKSLGEVEVTAGKLENLFQGIVKQISALDDVISEMSAASQEQSAGVGEVNMAVTQLDQVTQSNAASAEENASSSEELNGRVEELQEVVENLQMVVTGNMGELEDEEEEEEHPKPAPRRAIAQKAVAALPARAVKRERTEQRPTRKGRNEDAGRDRPEAGRGGRNPRSSGVKSSHSIPMPGEESPKKGDSDFGSSFKDF